MYYAVFVARVKQAMDMPHRLKENPEFAVVADGVGESIEEAVKIALQKNTMLNQLAVFHGKQVAELPNGKVIFRPAKFIWCLPKNEVEEEVSGLNGSERDRGQGQIRVPKQVSWVPQHGTSPAWYFGVPLAALAVLAIGAGVYFSHVNKSSAATAETAQTVGTERSSPSSTSTPSVSVQVTPLQAQPVAPSSFQLVSSDGGKVQLSWIGTASADGYLVYRSTSPSVSSARQIGSTTQPQFVDSNIQPMQTYYYWVASESSGGRAFSANQIKVTVPYTFTDLHTLYANDIVRVKTYTSILGVFGGSEQGTGWFLPNGDVVTCYHVVKNANYVIDVFMHNTNEKYHAKLVWKDSAHDLAVLQLKNYAGSPPNGGLKLSNTYRVGESVGVLGHPGGEALTMTTGVVEGMVSTESVTGYGTLHNMIAMNTPVVGGNSGSPVFNDYGQVIGIVESAGIHNGDKSYAVPSIYLQGQ